MAKYRVVMTKSAGLTSAERRARLGQVYRFLLGLANRTAVRDEVDGPTRTANRTPAPLRKRGTSRSIES